MRSTNQQQWSSNRNHDGGFKKKVEEEGMEMKKDEENEV